MPQEEVLPFADALRRLANPAAECGALYLSAQNDNLRRELPGLLADVGGPSAPLAVATAALGGEPEAVNIWIGGPGNTSSTHKDNLNNLYTVVTGVKRFVLLPPADILWLYETPLPSARFRHDAAACTTTCGRGGGGGGGGGLTPPGAPLPSCWRIDESDDSGGGGRVPWVAVDPSQPDLARFPLFSNATPIVVDVRAGETLFLPALWYHQVSHPPATVPRRPRGERGCAITAAAAADAADAGCDDTNGGTGLSIAVNAWYDLNYMSGQWAHFGLLRELAALTTRTVDAETAGV